MIIINCWDFNCSHIIMQFFFSQYTKHILLVTMKVLQMSFAHRHYLVNGACRGKQVSLTLLRPQFHLDTFTRFFQKNFMITLRSRVRHLGNTLLRVCNFPCRPSFTLYSIYSYIPQDHSPNFSNSKFLK